MNTIVCEKCGTSISNEAPWCWKCVKARFVYFILAPHSRCVKIGSAKNPDVRMKLYHTYTPEPIVLLGYSYQPSSTERILHRVLQEQGARLRYDKEWFELCKPVRDVIEEYVGECSIDLDEVPDFNRRNWDERTKLICNRCGLEFRTNVIPHGCVNDCNQPKRDRY